MSFMFSGLYEDIPDIDMYLERIGYHGGRKPALDDLKELIRKNQTHIPYSNLDFYHNRSCPSLAVPDIFEKLIIRQEGGGCFEINLLFFALLRSLGYDLFIVTVKCLFGSEDPVVPTHCAAVVTIDGSRYYVDVGLGLPSPVVPVELDNCSGWQPGIDSITKQYLYQLAYQKFINDHGFKSVKNCFLMPTEREGIEMKGVVSLGMLSSLGLQDIKVRFLPATMVYEHYLSGRKINIHDLQLDV